MKFSLHISGIGSSVLLHILCRSTLVILAMATLIDGISFLVKACAKVNELFNFSHGCYIVHYIDDRCVSADDHDWNILGVQ